MSKKFQQVDGTTLTEVYQIAYKNWKGEWVYVKNVFKSKAIAERERKALAKSRALNGQAVVYTMYQ